MSPTSLGRKLLESYHSLAGTPWILLSPFVFDKPRAALFAASARRDDSTVVSSSPSPSLFLPSCWAAADQTDARPAAARVLPLRVSLSQQPGHQATLKPGPRSLFLLLRTGAPFELCGRRAASQLPASPRLGVCLLVGLREGDSGDYCSNKAACRHTSRGPTTPDRGADVCDPISPSSPSHFASLIKVINARLSATGCATRLSRRLRFPLLPATD